MIRLNANLSKKVPMPGVEYSSQQFGASMEIEVSDADRPEAIHQRVRELFVTLSHAVDEQIAAQSGTNTPRPAMALSAAPASSPSPLIRQEQTFVPAASAPTNGNGYHAAPTNGHSNGNGNGNGYARRPAAPATGRPGSATQAQQKAIYAICKSLGLDLQAVLAEHGVGAIQELGIRDASRLIDELKARQNGNGSGPAR